ncbi:eukaryotic translation initiation factor 3G1 [Actinidia rufa]|uniref:Eukaryotic translation initiation factor 3G1 n=1 Tax=Actinidia rufa TaxID=165716 RepID=A0A7J0E8D2_9ERIC|nr:eukaryotic translation initiation factor 3G1 [Actinidia rufa]
MMLPYNIIHFKNLTLSQQQRKWRPNKLRWSEFNDDDRVGVNLEYLLPPSKVIGSNEDGINARPKTRHRSAQCPHRRAEVLGRVRRRRLTVVSTEDIVLERRNAPGLVVKRVTIGPQLVPTRILAHNLRWSLMNRLPSGDATANNSSYVPPSRSGGGAERSDGLEMRRRNDDYAIRNGNLSEDTLDFDLAELCCPFGHVLRAHVPKDFKTGLSRGYSFVNFVYWKDAERDINKLEGYGYDS